MDQIKIIPLGAGCQVGRSCIIIQHQGKKVMLDCGLHMGKNGQDAKPYFDRVNPQQLSMILITHSHLDHCGALPIFLSRTNFKGRVIMTRPTKQVYQYLLQDSIKVRSQNIKLYGSEQIRQSVSRIQTIDFAQQIIHQGIRVVAYCAGHVLGAAMFLVQIGQCSILYTGDYSCQQDRYIQPAQIPDVKIDILIVESTYGIRDHVPRPEREVRFTSKVEEIVLRGGKCLLPVFAVGRAEQLLMMLQEHWSSNQSQLANIRIYYTCALIQKCKMVYKTYLSMLSKSIQERFYRQQKDPFHFRYVHWLQSSNLLHKQTNDPLVMMCSPGMLQSGQSRMLLQKWCHNPNNGLILTGYCVEGSMADNLRKGNMIKNKQGQQVQVKMDVSVISFSAHADCHQTTDFIKALQPDYVVLVHGSEKNAKALQKHLKKEFQGNIKDIVAPQNCQEQIFQLKKKKSCQIVGNLLNKIQQHLNIKKQIKTQQNQQIQIEQQKIKSLPFEGILVNNQQGIITMQDNDYKNIFKKTQQIKIKQKLMVDFQGGLDLINYLSNEVFGLGVIKDKKVMLGDMIEISVQTQNKKAILFWQSSPKIDIMADEFAFLLAQISNSQLDFFNCDLKWIYE